MNEAEFYELTRQSQNTFSAKVLADSVNPEGTRLTTMEWTYPRCIHAEFMTHRQFSRNSASSRAIPLAKMYERIRKNPFFPLHWGKAQKGMQAEEELGMEEKLMAGHEWIEARNDAMDTLLRLEQIGIHKQVGNRITEPWMWITIICSGTNWNNLWALRCHVAAEPHFQYIAYLAKEAYNRSTPKKLRWGDWHLPLVNEQDVQECPLEDLPLISTGRCARVSYLTHHGVRDPKEDVALCRRLMEHKPMHASPLEHPARAVNPNYDMTDPNWGNYDPGWLQLRKTLQDECVR